MLGSPEAFPPDSILGEVKWGVMTLEVGFSWSSHFSLS